MSIYYLYSRIFNNFLCRTRNGAEVITDRKHVNISTLPDGSSTLVLEKVSIGDAKTYHAVATNSVGEAITSAELKVAGNLDT